MNEFTKIDFLLKEKGLNQNDLTNYLNVPKSSYTDWKNGRTSSYKKYLPQIAKYLDVSVDDLLDSGDAYSFWKLLSRLCRIKSVTLDELAGNLHLSDSFAVAAEQGSLPDYEDIRNIAVFMDVPENFLIESRPKIRVEGKLYQFSSSPCTWHISLLEDYIKQPSDGNLFFIRKKELKPIEEELKKEETPDLADTEMQDVIIYNRNGKTVRKRLPKAEYEAAIKMLDALGSDFPDV